MNASEVGAPHGHPGCPRSAVRRTGSRAGRPVGFEGLRALGSVLGDWGSGSWVVVGFRA